MLSYKEIKELIDLACERGLSALEIEQAGFRVRIEAASRGNGLAAAAGAPAAVAPAPPPAPAVVSGEPGPEEGLHVITSPIVGTFYRSPSPEADPFAEVGQRIARGKILCIIESMKLMNEIESDVAGEIVKKLVANNAPIEYGQELFAIRPQK